MITAVHTLVYADDADRVRDFFRDVLNWPCVDAGGGWLIFKTGPSELGVHPTDHAMGQHHQISLMCDDIEATRAELEAKGATFSAPVTDEGYGLVTAVDVPGADPIQIYQPRHRTAYDL
jgi:predicted enzyme related to lactoylglutathione lyase